MWLADDAQRVRESRATRAFAFGQVDERVLDSRRRRNAVALRRGASCRVRVRPLLAAARGSARRRSSVSVWPQSWRTSAVFGPSPVGQRGQVRPSDRSRGASGTRRGDRGSSPSRRPRGCRRRSRTAGRAAERAAQALADARQVAGERVRGRSGRARSPSAPTAARFTIMPVRLAMKNRTTCGPARRAGRRTTPSGPGGPRDQVAVSPSRDPRETRRSSVRRRRCPGRHVARAWLARRAARCAACGGGGDRHTRSAVRPAAAERQVEAQAELLRPVGREAQAVEKSSERYGTVLCPSPLVERDRVDRLHLEAADAARLHRAQLALELVVSDDGPNHHQRIMIPRRPAARRTPAGVRLLCPHLVRLVSAALAAAEIGPARTEREHARSGGAPRTNH